MVSRRDNVGFYPCLPLMELALEVDIPQEIIEHPTIVALVRDATDMILLCNVVIRFLFNSLILLITIFDLYPGHVFIQEGSAYG